MITSTDISTIAITTIAINTITLIMITIFAIPNITINISIASIRPNGNWYVYKLCKASSGCCCSIWVWDLLSQISNCLPFQQNQSLQLWTPWPSGNVRSGRGGHAKESFQTIIWTDIKISAGEYLQPPIANHRSPTTILMTPGVWHLQRSKSLDGNHRSIHASI